MNVMNNLNKMNLWMEMMRKIENEFYMNANFYYRNYVGNIFSLFKLKVKNQFLFYVLYLQIN